MNPDRWQRIQDLFNGALRVPEEERAGWLISQEGDAELVEEVLSMISAASEPLAGTRGAAAALGFDLPAVGTPVAGTRLDDFELLEEIGRGAMGVVFKSRQVSLDRIVALKVLPIHLLTTLETIERFRREGRAAAGLQHPRIVAVHQVLELDTAHLIAMEFFERSDLARELRAQRIGGGGVLPLVGSPGHITSCVQLVRDIAEALDYAHGRGLIHRDVKPQNLFLGHDGRLKLGDFGLALTRGETRLSVVGTLVGTVAYMSPEQARRAKNKIDHRTDIYSLGAVLYELLGLRPPFEADSDVDLLERVSLIDPTPIRRRNRAVPPDLQIICQTAMAKEPNDRYQSAQVFADDLGRFLNHESILASPPSPLSLARRHVRRRWRRYAVLVLIPMVVWASLTWSATVRRNQSFDATLTVCEAELAAPSFSTSPFARRMRLRASVEALLQKRSMMTAALASRVDELEEGVSEHAAEVTERALQAIDLGYRMRKGIEPVDFDSIQLGFALLEEARALSWTQPDAREDSLRAILPRLSAEATDSRGLDVECEVLLRGIDPILSEPLDLMYLGVTPLAPTPVQPGYYRVVIVHPDGPFREFTRLIDRSVQDIRVGCSFVQRTRQGGSMARIEGETFQLPEPYGTTSIPHTGVQVSLPSFLIDRGTVTVGDYRAYLTERGLGPPGFWGILDVEAPEFWPRLVSGDYDSRPMTGLTWSEAQEFAEWYGLRLPTALERDLVARGNEGRFFPDGSPDIDSYFADWPDRILVEDGSRTSMALAYLECALPSLGFDPRPSPDGVEMLLGNIWEFTESLGTQMSDGSYLPDTSHRVVAGASWSGRPRSGLNNRSRGVAMTGIDSAQPKFGFRCAVSLAP